MAHVICLFVTVELWSSTVCVSSFFNQTNIVSFIDTQLFFYILCCSSNDSKIPVPKEVLNLGNQMELPYIRTTHSNNTGATDNVHIQELTNMAAVLKWQMSN